jgi:lipoprotein-anchoring transpeptidase ErfK/SrfK
MQVQHVFMTLCFSTSLFLISVKRYSMTHQNTVRISPDLLAQSTKSIPHQPWMPIPTPTPTPEIPPLVMSRANLPTALYQKFTASLTIPPAEEEPYFVVDLSDRTVALYIDNRIQATYPVAVGQEGWETPVGHFHITDMQKNPAWQHPITGETVFPGPDNPLGDRWIEFWSDGTYRIGFHGTNQASSIGQAVSHGCVRMQNADIQKMYAEIHLGTSVVVQP